MTRNHRKYKTTSSKEDWHCSKTKHKTDAKENEEIKKTVEIEKEYKESKLYL